jgi:hypothetical protein
MPENFEVGTEVECPRCYEDMVVEVEDDES